MALLDAITRFVDEFNQEEENLGTLTLLPDEQLVPEKLLAIGQLRTFYARVVFEELIIGRGFVLDWAPLAQLPRYQEGWGIIYDTDPAGTPDTQYWNADWLVFGDKNGDAIFTKLADPASPVLGSIQKAEAFHLASSLESFLTILTAGMVMVREEFQYETKLEDYTPKPEFLARVRELVTQQEDADTAEQFVNFFFG